MNAVESVKDTCTGEQIQINNSSSAGPEKSAMEKSENNLKEIEKMLELEHSQSYSQHLHYI
jgi:hypothetical protein